MSEKVAESNVRRLIPSPGLLALAFCCCIVVVVYFSRGCDPLAFALIGTRFAQGDSVGSKGYDGQFAYYIARDPASAPAYLDNLAYRYQRILYPMLARLLSLGRPTLVPWALLLINVVSISMSTELVGRMLARNGINSYFALLLPLWMGQIFALRADLNEPLCFLFVIAALRWHEQEQHMLSIVALAASVLTKEVGALFLFSILFAVLFQKRVWLAMRYLLLTLLPYVALQVWLTFWIGGSGLANVSSRFECVPFYGFTFIEPLAARVFAVFILALPVSGLLIFAVCQLWKTPCSVRAWALAVNCLFIVFLTRRTAVDVLAAFRVTTGAVVAALHFCAARRWRWLAWPLWVFWLPPSVLALIIPGFLW
jgi:hypothetical protein